MSQPPHEFEPEYRSLEYGEYALDVEVPPASNKEQAASVGMGFNGTLGAVDTTKETRIAMLTLVKEQMDSRGFTTGVIVTPYENEPYSFFEISAPKNVPFKSAIELRAMVENAVKPIEKDLHRMAANNMVSRLFNMKPPVTAKPAEPTAPTTTIAETQQHHPLLAKFFTNTPGEHGKK